MLCMPNLSRYYSTATVQHAINSAPWNTRVLRLPCHKGTILPATKTYLSTTLNISLCINLESLPQQCPQSQGCLVPNVGPSLLAAWVKPHTLWLSPRPQLNTLCWELLVSSDKWHKAGILQNSNWLGWSSGSFPLLPLKRVSALIFKWLHETQVHTAMFYDPGFHQKFIPVSHQKCDTQSHPPLKTSAFLQLAAVASASKLLNSFSTAQKNLRTGTETRSLSSLFSPSASDKHLCTAAPGAHSAGWDGSDGRGAALSAQSCTAPTRQHPWSCCTQSCTNSSLFFETNILPTRK